MARGACIRPLEGRLLADVLELPASTGTDQSRAGGSKGTTPLFQRPGETRWPHAVGMGRQVRWRGVEPNGHRLPGERIEMRQPRPFRRSQAAHTAFREAEAMRRLIELCLAVFIGLTALHLHQLLSAGTP